MSLIVKRLIDVSGAAMGIIVVSPVMIVAAILILIDSGRPIIYRQKRVGLNGGLFDLFKFRTMVRDAERIGAGLSVEEGDARITRIGGLLRKASLDELPQLLNVVKGDISLVGPRPVIPAHLEFYGDFERKRLRVKPGLTGLATIRGRASIPWSERIRHDVEYVENFSLWLDLKIIICTVFVVLTGKGIYYDHEKNGPAFDLPQKKKESHDS